MNMGMMWFDNNANAKLADKVQRAATYYHEKYGRMPDVCLVNPDMLGGKRPELIEGRGGKILVRPFRSVLPGHLWIGVDDKASS